MRREAVHHKHGRLRSPKFLWFLFDTRAGAAQPPQDVPWSVTKPLVSSQSAWAQRWNFPRPSTVCVSKPGHHARSIDDHAYPLHFLSPEAPRPRGRRPGCPWRRSLQRPARFVAGRANRIRADQSQGRPTRRCPCPAVGGGAFAANDRASTASPSTYSGSQRSPVSARPTGRS